MTTRIFIILLILLTSCPSISAQPRYDFTQLQVERIDRGVVAIRQDDSHVVVSWRTLKSDKKGQPFDIYRNGKKLNRSALTKGGTFYVDEWPQGEQALYEVKGGNCDGSFVLKADAPQGYLPLKLNKPEGGTLTEGGRPYAYIANDASVADVDGDGQYEIILKWDPTNSRDNAHDGFTAPTLFDCYRLDGTQLWRINLGRNIRSGAHYVPFIVFDLDGDGRAELAVKTADGTTDSKGKVIGNPDADYRSPQGRILSGPEYLTIFNGLTGEAMDTRPYLPERGELSEWGDTKGNRSERYLAAVGYLDGKHASVIFCRGYYTRSVLAAWDWDGHQLKERWVFDTNNPQWRDYAGQGNHNLRVADVDGDGCDEITYGAMAVDHDGRGLYNTGMGHGDALHLTAFDPSTDELQVWDCHENKRDGSDFRDAKTGKVIFQIPSNEDVGRAMAADIDPTHPGVEMWSTASHGIRNIRGEVITEGRKSETENTHVFFGGMRVSVNFGIWWDGDLLRELLDHETVSKYNWQNHTPDIVQRFDGCQFNNGTKSNPCLSADILGDWREEVITRDRMSEELRIYVTTIPTDYRIDCLMHDIPYRLSVATENVGYNQPPETGFYLGPDKKDYLKNLP